MKMYVHRTIGSLCTLIREEDSNLVTKLMKQQEEQSKLIDYFLILNVKLNRMHIFHSRFSYK